MSTPPDPAATPPTDLRRYGKIEMASDPQSDVGPNGNVGNRSADHVGECPRCGLRHAAYIQGCTVAGKTLLDRWSDPPAPSDAEVRALLAVAEGAESHLRGAPDSRAWKAYQDAVKERPQTVAALARALLEARELAAGDVLEITNERDRAAAYLRERNEARAALRNLVYSGPCPWCARDVATAALHDLVFGETHDGRPACRFCLRWENEVHRVGCTGAAALKAGGE